jgi:hypothetical protein
VERATMIAHYREYHLRKAMADKIVHDVTEEESKKPGSGNDSGGGASPIDSFLNL